MIATNSNETLSKMPEELILKTNIKRESGWIYFIDKDGDICRGRMCGIIQRNPLKYAKPERILKLGIKREKGYLYFIDKDANVKRDRLKNEGRKDG